MPAMSAAARRCFLHVGSPKTGTSYLQSVLWGSRPALAEQGLELPLKPGDHFRLTLALRDLLDERMDPPAAFNVLERLGEAVERSTADRLLISHELLAPVTADRARMLHDLLPDFEVHIVITARDLARQVPAEWQQGVKHRSTRTYEDFLGALVRGKPPHFWAVQDYADVASRWRGDLPAQRVHIVTVPQGKAPPGMLLQRFCSVLDVDPARLDTLRVNASMGAEQAELLRRVNVALGDRLPHPRAGYARVAKDHLGDRVLATQSGQPLRLPRRLEGWAHETSLGMAARARAAGYDVVGDLDEVVSPAPSGVEDHGGSDDGWDVSEAAISTAAVDAIAALLDQRHRDLEELRSLRAAARRAGSERQAGPSPEPERGWTTRAGAIRQVGSALRSSGIGALRRRIDSLRT
jgi:hypothetical protein